MGDNVSEKKKHSQKRSRDPMDIYYPVPENLCIEGMEKPKVNQSVLKRIAQTTIKTAYHLKDPKQHDYYGNPIEVEKKSVASQSQIDLVVSLIESLNPKDAVEAALVPCHSLILG